MNDTKDNEQYTRKELLQQCWAEQRQEITYRRDREQFIFQTSATIWIGLLGALLVNGQTNNPLLKEAGIGGRLGFTFIVLIVAGITHGWIRKQRKARVRSQEALVDIQKQCGCFEPGVTDSPVLPKEFHDDWAKVPFDAQHRRKKGSFKYAWSWFLPNIVILLIWLSHWMSPPASSAQPASTNAVLKGKP